MFSRKPNYEKLKTNLRLAIQRLRLLEKKKNELAQKSRKEIADYIAAGKEDRARIRVEHIVQQDYLVEALEIIESFCDILLARFGLIKSMAQMEPDLDKPIASIIWSSLRVVADVPELKEIVKQFIAKYGEEYVAMCRKNDCDLVDQKLKYKLSLYRPPKRLLEQYMVEIAASYNVPFEPDPMVMLGEDVPPAVSNDLIDLGMGGKKFPPPGGPGSGSGGHFPVATAQQPIQPMQPYPPAPPQASYPPEAAAYPPMGPSCPPPAPGQNASFPPQNASYPPQGGPPSSGAPPPLPSVPPAAGAGGVLPRGSASDANSTLPSYTSVMTRQPSPPPAYNNNEKPTLPMPPQSNNLRPENTLPELPSVPLNNLNTPGNSFGTSAGGEDVDFDDLTRRFEELKKRK